MSFTVKLIQRTVAEQCLLEWDGPPGTKPPVPLLKDMFSSERRKAKVLNFSIAYGKTAHGLSKDWKVDLTEAQNTVDRWYGDRPEVSHCPLEYLPNQSPHTNGSLPTKPGGPIGLRRFVAHVTIITTQNSPPCSAKLAKLGGFATHLHDKPVKKKGVIKTAIQNLIIIAALAHFSCNLSSFAILLTRNALTESQKCCHRARTKAHSSDQSQPSLQQT